MCCAAAWAEGEGKVSGVQPYQEEYLAVIREAAALTVGQELEGEASLAAYEDWQRRREAMREKMALRGMELLRRNLFPVLDHLFEAEEKTLTELEEFASQLWSSSEAQDQGLFRLIHQALLSLARQKEDRAGMIRHLYWLGMGYHGLCNRLVGLELETVEKYLNRMRLCFTEAAAYLKYFDEIGDEETCGYIIRSRANMSLGLFRSPGEKIRMVRETLQIVQDESYRKVAPGLPWDRYTYMVHQQMATCISYNKEKAMSPEDTACIMESAYIVYQRRIQETKERCEMPPLRWAFPYYAIEYYCGINDLDRLLSGVESLLDAVDPNDHSPDGIYGMLSLPAFYCQYLIQYPERIPGREAYIDGLFRRALDYAYSFPAQEEGQILLYLRHLCYMYLETGMPFGEFLQKLMLRFMPEAYLHSWMVGTAAQALCGLILEEEPAFFDDIPEIRRLTDRSEKRRRVLEDAMQSGLLHDAGRVSVLEMYSRTPRQWLEEEYGVTHLHAAAGQVLLSERPSTSRFAPVALGHHAWYDGSSRGYPAAYKRLECPCRQMVDVVGLIDWMENITRASGSHTGVRLTFDEAAAEAVKLEGKRFSPMLTARLRDKRITERLRQAFEDGRREAYRQMYERNILEKR